MSYVSTYINDCFWSKREKDHHGLCNAAVRLVKMFLVIFDNSLKKHVSCRKGCLTSWLLYFFLSFKLLNCFLFVCVCVCFKIHVPLHGNSNCVP